MEYKWCMAAVSMIMRASSSEVFASLIIVAHTRCLSLPALYFHFSQIIFITYTQLGVQDTSQWDHSVSSLRIRQSRCGGLKQGWENARCQHEREDKPDGRVFQEVTVLAVAERHRKALSKIFITVEFNWWPYVLKASSGSHSGEWWRPQESEASRQHGPECCWSQILHEMSFEALSITSTLAEESVARLLQVWFHSAAWVTSFDPFP